MPALKNQKDVQKAILTVRDVAAALGVSADRICQLIAEREKHQASPSAARAAAFAFSARPLRNTYTL